MEKNKKPITIDFDALDSDLIAHQEEINIKSEPLKKLEPKEKKSRSVKKKESHGKNEGVGDREQSESNITQRPSNRVDLDEQNEIAHIQHEIDVNIKGVSEDSEPVKAKAAKKQTNLKENSTPNGSENFEIEFWKDQNASCCLTFKPGIERQIIKRVKNNTISYTIEYNPD